MEERTTRATPNTDVDVWTWIFLAGILALAVLIGLGALGIMSMNEQSKGAALQPTAPAAAR